MLPLVSTHDILSQYFQGVRKGERYILILFLIFERNKYSQDIMKGTNTGPEIPIPIIVAILEFLQYIVSISVYTLVNEIRPCLLYLVLQPRRRRRGTLKRIKNKSAYRNFGTDRCQKAGRWVLTAHPQESWQTII